MSTKDAHRPGMSDGRRRARLELQAKLLEIASEVADATGWERSQVEMLLRQARWDVMKAKAKIERCSAEFTVAEADMIGSYADRRQQAIAFLIDALACNRTEASKLLAGAGGRVEKVIAELIRKHKALKRRRKKYADDDTAAAAARVIASGTEPTTDEAIEPVDEPVDISGELDEAVDQPIDIAGECATEVDAAGNSYVEEVQPSLDFGEDVVCLPQCEQGGISDSTIVVGAGSSSLECESADEDEIDVMQAIHAVDAKEIECLALVFELELTAARKYHGDAVPARNGTCFEAAANSIIAEYVAEIIDYVDKRASQKLHKMKQAVMRRSENWNGCRMRYFPFVHGRDLDPVGDAFASCFELADNRLLLPCGKKGCCVVSPSHMQPSSGKAVVVHSDAVASVATSGGKAKMVYTGKTKL